MLEYIGFLGMLTGKAQVALIHAKQEDDIKQRNHGKRSCDHAVVAGQQVIRVERNQTKV